MCARERVYNICAPDRSDCRLGVYNFQYEVASPARMDGVARIGDESARLVSRENGISVLQELRTGGAKNSGY